MWLLYVHGHATCVCLLAGESYRVGKRGCHFVIADDRSISRTHLLLELGAAHEHAHTHVSNDADKDVSQTTTTAQTRTPTPLTLVDLSTYGTTVLPWCTRAHTGHDDDVGDSDKHARVDDAMNNGGTAAALLALLSDARVRRVRVRCERAVDATVARRRVLASAVRAATRTTAAATLSSSSLSVPTAGSKRARGEHDDDDNDKDKDHSNNNSCRDVDAALTPAVVAPRQRLTRNVAWLLPRTALDDDDEEDDDDNGTNNNNNNTNAPHAWRVILGNHHAQLRLVWCPVTAVLRHIAHEQRTKLLHALAQCGLRVLHERAADGNAEKDDDDAVTVAGVDVAQLTRRMRVTARADVLITNTLHVDAVTLAALCRGALVVSPSFVLALRDAALPSTLLLQQQQQQQQQQQHATSVLFVPPQHRPVLDTAWCAYASPPRPQRSATRHHSNNDDSNKDGDDDEMGGGMARLHALLFASPSSSSLPTQQQRSRLLQTVRCVTVQRACFVFTAQVVPCAGGCVVYDDDAVQQLQQPCTAQQHADDDDDNSNNACSSAPVTAAVVDTAVSSCARAFASQYAGYVFLYDTTDNNKDDDAAARALRIALRRHRCALRCVSRDTLVRCLVHAQWPPPDDDNDDEDSDVTCDDVVSDVDDVVTGDKHNNKEKSNNDADDNSSATRDDDDGGSAQRRGHLTRPRRAASSPHVANVDDDAEQRNSSGGGGRTTDAAPLFPELTTHTLPEQRRQRQDSGGDGGVRRCVDADGWVTWSHNDNSNASNHSDGDTHAADNKDGSSSTATVCPRSAVVVLPAYPCFLLDNDNNGRRQHSATRQTARCGAFVKQPYVRTHEPPIVTTAVMPDVVVSNNNNSSNRRRSLLDVTSVTSLPVHTLPMTHLASDAACGLSCDRGASRRDAHTTPLTHHSSSNNNADNNNNSSSMSTSVHEAMSAAAVALSRASVTHFNAYDVTGQNALHRRRAHKADATRTAATTRRTTGRENAHLECDKDDGGGDDADSNAAPQHTRQQRTLNVFDIDSLF